MTEPVRRPWLFALVAALLALHYALAVGSKFSHSTTSDEIVHVTGGFNFNHFHDYRLHPENGILPQRVAALPATLAGARFPSLDQIYWRKSDAWVLAHQFFYETGEDHFPRLMAGRALIALFNVATGLLVFAWSRRLFGDAGGLVSLLLFVFEPNFLAHGALATSDACMSFFLIASVAAWWKHLHDGRQRWWWLSAVTFGLACVAKYSAPLLLPMFVALAAVRAWSAEPLTLLGRRWTSRSGKIGAAALSAFGQGLVAVVIIWVFFGFRFSAAHPALPPFDHFIRPWEWIDANLGTQGKILRAMAAIHLLPEGYLYGMAYVLETAQIRSAFLNGEFSTTGWPTFFLWTFALKTTLPLLGASLAAFALLARRWRDECHRLAPLAALFVVYWAYSITVHLNIGHRHILPTYPVLFIAAGALGAWLRSRRWWAAAAVAALLAWHGAESLRVAPHFLAYFNQLAGGPINGHRHLVDSSLDWGQDLPGLKRWLDANGKTGEPVYLSYFGTGEPDYYGIRARRLMFVNGFKLPQPPLASLEPGVYCLGATILEQVYSPVRGPWTLELEQEFQAARSLERAMRDYQQNPARRDELLRDGSKEKWESVIKRYEWLRLARLCHYLRARGADAHVGYSIFIYRLAADELRAATAGTLQAWARLIERTARSHRG
ncbi:MAG: glycosyltransferase family 39 protein [Verrucomicrobia bacterium]|nr:glycosyltransferase family 39 protein [Verrucomicrobiota bacterium]